MRGARGAGLGGQKDEIGGSERQVGGVKGNRLGVKQTGWEGSTKQSGGVDLAGQHNSAGRGVNDTRWGG